MKIRRVLSNSKARFICALIVALALSFSSRPADGAVWEAENAWNLQWEDRYAEWIAQEVDIDFLKSIDLPVDCADLVYVVRAIFSRIHALPFMATNIEGQRIGHFSSDWDNLATARQWSNDRRFLAFLRALTRHITTRSFPHDTYPVALKPETIQPGLILYENMISSHSCLIGRVDPQRMIPVVFFEASVPARVEFKRSVSPNIHIYPPGVDPSRSGVVRWKWPTRTERGWRYLPEDEMTFFSMDIYSEDFPYRNHVSRALNRVVKGETEEMGLDHAELIGEIVEMFEEDARFRSRLVKEAYAHLRRNPRAASDEGFEFSYGTHSRDLRIRELIGEIWGAIYQYDIPRADFFSALRQIPISIDPALPEVTLMHLFITLHQHWTISKASASPQERWGLFWREDEQEWYFNNEHPAPIAFSWYETAESRQDVLNSLLQSADG